nr:hypothetical protein [Tanacetum cinerariifolium]
MSKDINFGDLFFNDKPSEADNDKVTAEIKVRLMVSVTIQQDMSSIPPMTSAIIDLTSRPKSPNVHQQFKTTITETTTTTTTLPLPSSQHQSTAEAMMMKHIGELEHIMANLIQENKGLEERLDKHGARLYTLEQLDIPHQVSKAVAHDLLSLQKPKKKSPADQYIFKRCTSTPTGSSRHDEPSYAELGQSKSEESEKVVPGADEAGQGEGHAGPDPGAQAKGQTGSDTGAQDESQAGSLVVHAGSDREHMDLDVADVSPQPSMEQLDEGFTATAYPKEPASLSGTLSSLQHMSKDINFGDLFFNDKPSEADNDKVTAEIKVRLMVSVTIQQDMYSIPPMTSAIIDLTSRPKSPNVHQQFKTTITETTTTTTTLPLPSSQHQSTAEAMMMKHIGELEHIMANLIQENKGLEERLDKHGARLYTLEQLDIPHQVSKAVSEVVTEAVDWAMQADEGLSSSYSRTHTWKRL